MQAPGSRGLYASPLVARSSSGEISGSPDTGPKGDRPLAADLGVDPLALAWASPFMARPLTHTSHLLAGD